MWRTHILAQRLYLNDNGVSRTMDRKIRSADTLARRNGGFADRGTIHDYLRIDLMFLWVTLGTSSSALLIGCDWHFQERKDLLLRLREFSRKDHEVFAHGNFVSFNVSKKSDDIEHGW